VATTRWSTSSPLSSGRGDVIEVGFLDARRPFDINTQHHAGYGKRRKILWPTGQGHALVVG
jgi:hypothetical protein